MTTCLFPGSFDPPTAGHADLIRRAARLFDRVYVAVMVNADKRPMFTSDERVGFLKACVKDLGNVEIVSDSGLTLDLARRVGADVLLRGLRGEGDAGFESQLAAANRYVGGIETVALFTDPALSFISSTIVRDVIRSGGPLKGLVPVEIEDRLINNMPKGDQ